MLVIKWDSTPEVRHEATFVSSFIGVRVVVDTYRGDEETPCRVEAGAYEPMLKALLDPAGRYRLAPMIEQTFRAKLDALLKDHEPDLEPKTEPSSGLHPLIAQALAPWAPKASNVHQIRRTA